MDGSGEAANQTGNEASSPYVDSDTGFLRNELNAKTQEELTGAWADRLPGQLEELAASSIPCTGDRAHLQAIHRLLFEGVFEWAGQFRTTDIDKQGTDFVPAGEIEASIEHLFSYLAAENLLKDLPREQFVDHLAFYYAQLNHIHPFREGNGRTQRLFWWHVSLHAGWTVDIERMHKATNNEASRAASQVEDLAPLIALLDDLISPAPSVEQGTAKLITSVRRKQRWRKLQYWLSSHANPDRMPQSDDGNRQSEVQ